MYSGVGVQTPGGSRTNSNVQRNWAIVRKTKGKVTYNMKEGKSDQLNEQSNKHILDPVRRRKIEIECAELADILEEQGFASELITKKIDLYRSILMGTDKKKEKSSDVRETNQKMTEAQQRRLKKQAKNGPQAQFLQMLQHISDSTLVRHKKIRTEPEMDTT